MPRQPARAGCKTSPGRTRPTKQQARCALRQGFTEPTAAAPPTNLVGSGTGHIQKRGHNQQAALPQPVGSGKLLLLLVLLLPCWRRRRRQQRLIHSAAPLRGIGCRQGGGATLLPLAILLPPPLQPLLEPVHQGHEGQDERHSQKHEESVGQRLAKWLGAPICKPWGSHTVQALAEQRGARPCGTGAAR